MGVLGLDYFANDLFKEFELKTGQQVVVDGPSLLRFMCKNSVLYGGEYQTLYETIKEFFTKMVADAGISIVIVMDGAWADVKVKIIKKRHVQKLKQLKKWTDKSKADQARQQPAFAMKCFTDVLAECGEEDSMTNMVEIITAPFEADVEVAREAGKRGCPVVSTDSDMIIFNIAQGYIKLSTLKWKDIKKDASYVECQRLMSTDVAKALGIETARLPLFATLREFINFQEYWYGPHTNDYVKGFLWLSEFMQQSPNDDEVMRSVRLGDQKLQEMIIKYRSYNLEDEEANPRDHKIPSRIRAPLESGKLYHGALVVWLQEMFIPKKQVIDFSKRSSNGVSRNLRCMWYSIICAGQRDELIELSRKSGTTEAVEGHVVLKKEIELNDGTTIDLRQLDHLDATTKRKLLLFALECEDEEPDLTEWPNDPTIELPARVTTFWKTKTRPKDHIKRALVDFLTKPSDSVEDLPLSFNLDMAHAYAQWQSCLMSAYDLNIILGCPLPDFKIKVLLGNGSLLHRMCPARC